MKTAISIPNPLFRSADRLARRHGWSRSKLYAEALDHFLESHSRKGITEKLNQVYGNLRSSLDSALGALQFRTLRRSEW